MNKWPNITFTVRIKVRVTGSDYTCLGKVLQFTIVAKLELGLRLVEDQRVGMKFILVRVDMVRSDTNTA